MITDADWIAAFGTTDSQIEPAPKSKKTKLDRGQYEAGLILAKPELFAGSYIRTPTVATQDTHAAQAQPEHGRGIAKPET